MVKYLLKLIGHVGTSEIFLHQSEDDYNPNEVVKPHEPDFLGQQRERYELDRHLSPRIMAYSAHDTDVAPLLAALGVYPGGTPSYASVVLIELLGPISPGNITNYRLRVLFKNGPSDHTGTMLQFPACKDILPSLGCRLDLVIQSIKPFILNPKVKLL
ncbi:unnamed protein product [Protopolystoma xenopodis]|uniref:Uncharacterized protein n=1 Tax=Protopolystoma xenopodis TaxID=117903 RepID=A0A3S4ZZ93_9PLAT|nr:unnamed protein product [Protopolystoma xenopodis]